MATPYGKHVNRFATAQTMPIPGKESEMVENSAGGFTYSVGKWEQLNRFLIMGSASGTYYASESKLTRENAVIVGECLKEDYIRTIDTIVSVSDGGKAPSNDPAIFALAIAISAAGEDPKAIKIRQYAAANLNKVCRIGTHLFTFVEYAESMRRWGRLFKNAIANWYVEKRDDNLAYQLVKYQSRGKWSHRDLLRKVHVQPENLTPMQTTAIDYVVHKDKEGYILPEKEDLSKFIWGLEKLRRASVKKKEASKVAKIIAKYDMPRETVPTEYLNSPEVWQAMLPHMPLTALIRNLNKMTAISLIKPLSAELDQVLAKLGDKEYIHKSRLHPMTILVALKQYSQGKGDKGSLTWNPLREIKDALDEAFYMSFDNIEPTNKKHLLALDVSGSMGSPAAGLASITCREATAVMAMTLMRVEKHTHIIGFTASSRAMYNPFSLGRYGNIVFNGETQQQVSPNDGITVLDISPKMRLDKVCQYINGLAFGSTDCSLPMIYAQKNNFSVDAFIVMTDSETFAGTIHPSQALAQYRKHSGINNAKEVVMGMTATNFTIADPKDPLTLDIVGLSTSTPSVIADFIRQ